MSRNIKFVLMYRRHRLLASYLLHKDQKVKTHKAVFISRYTDTPLTQQISFPFREIWSFKF
jgi:hypothetical protein